MVGITIWAFCGILEGNCQTIKNARPTVSAEIANLQGSNEINQLKLLFDGLYLNLLLSLELPSHAAPKQQLEGGFDNGNGITMTA